MMIDDCAPDNISGEHEEDTPHAGEQGGRDKGEEDQPVPEAQVAHLDQGGVIVLVLLASIRVTHHYCSDSDSPVSWDLAGQR